MNRHQPPRHPDPAPPAFETVYPLRRDRHGRPRPFPTIHWLTDPALDRAIADLERRGTIGHIDTLLRHDDNLARRFHHDHIRYRAARWTMLTAPDRTTVTASRSLTRAFAGGIAGTADFRTVKCLHAHVAHHLADPQTGNTIAALLIERFGLTVHLA